MTAATRPPVIFLMGPTASGKTDLAVSLVADLDCEIISVDSAMIYRHMNIGTAKPDASLLNKAPHHLIDIRNPNESYSVAEFCRDADQLIKQIHARQHIPLLAGGTMMYFHALQFGISALPDADQTLRSQLDTIARQQGWPALHRRLAGVDPESAAKIHPNDGRRIQRALEVYERTGVKMSSYHARSVACQHSAVSIVNLGLFPAARSRLHAGIETRFDAMLANGLIDELKQLRQAWRLAPQMPAMRCVGYRQAWHYLENKCSYQTMRDQAIAATRQLAKRQLTWLRHYPGINLADPYTLSTEHIKNQIICQIQATNW